MPVFMSAKTSSTARLKTLMISQKPMSTRLRLQNQEVSLPVQCGGYLKQKQSENLKVLTIIQGVGNVSGRGKTKTIIAAHKAHLCQTLYQTI